MRACQQLTSVNFNRNKGGASTFPIEIHSNACNENDSQPCGGFSFHKSGELPLKAFCELRMARLPASAIIFAAPTQALRSPMCHALASGMVLQVLWLSQE